MMHKSAFKQLERRNIFAFCFSLTLFIVAPLFTELGRDQLAIYKQALNIYLNHAIPIEGPEIIYTGTSLPGSLQSLLVGIPLFLSDGMPWAAAVLIGLFNFITAFGLFLIHKKLFKSMWEEYPFIFFSIFMFNPWLIRFTELWNPSYLPFLGMTFMVGVYLNLETNSRFLGSALTAVSILWAFQLHLSFVILCFLLAFSWTKRKFSLLGLASGVIVGAITLIPKIYAILQATPKVEDGNFIFKNIVFSFSAILDFPKIILRFLSFGTGEISRFFGGSKGIGGAFQYTLKEPVLFFFFIVTILFSLKLIILGLRFYFEKERYKNLIQRQPQFETFVSESSLLLPYVLTLMFVFSIKGPSAHTFWVALPWAFYPILKGLQKALPKVRSHANWVWVIYLVSSLICTGWSFKKVWSGSILNTHLIFARSYPDQFPPKTLDSKRKGVYETYINVKERTESF